MSTARHEWPEGGRPVKVTLGVVLVAVGVLGVLAALLLPAVQSARRSERPGRNFSQGPLPAGSVISADSFGDDDRSDLASALMPPPAQAAAASPAPAEAQAAPVARALANRKIIHEATVDLVTEDLNKLEAALLALVAARGGYVADSDRSGLVGTTRRGSWKVRVPADGYDAFVRGAIGLGELVSTRANSQDVGAEYYDLDARLGAKKVEETRLLKHLADSTGRLEEILAVERELARVRGEVEQMQGRLNYLTNLTTLATVTVTAAEIKDYAPPQAPTLGHRVARTFAASLDSLRSFGESVLLAAVALAPWFPLLILAGLVLWLTLRRIGARPSRAELRRAGDAPPPPPQETPATR